MVFVYDDGMLMESLWVVFYIDTMCWTHSSEMKPIMLQSRLRNPVSLLHAAPFPIKVEKKGVLITLFIWRLVSSMDWLSVVKDVVYGRPKGEH